MANKIMLMQSRKGMTALINMNPTKVDVYSRSLVSDGFGGYVEDQSAALVKSGSLTVRISHERLIVPDNQEGPSGLSTNLGRYVSSDYKNVLTTGSIIRSFDGKEWKVGVVDPLYAFGGIKGYQATLTEGNIA